MFDSGIGVSERWVVHPRPYRLPARLRPLARMNPLLPYFRRYFEIADSGTIDYYVNQSDARSKGVISLLHATIQKKNGTKTPKSAPYALEVIEDGGKNFVLCCESSAERDSWLSSMQKVIRVAALAASRLDRFGSDAREFLDDDSIMRDDSAKLNMACVPPPNSSTPLTPSETPKATQPT